MRFILILLFLGVFNFPFCQVIDTVKYELYTDIYDCGKIIKKEFDKISIVYEYNKNGDLIRRKWFNKKGVLIGIVLD